MIEQKKLHGVYWGSLVLEILVRDRMKNLTVYKAYTRPS